MSNVILTTSGTSFVATAGTAGPYFPLKYFLLAYDYRFDHNVLPSSSLIPVSAGEYTSAVNMTGDVIYNLDTLSTSSYSISNNEMLIYDPNQSGTSTITGNRFDSTAYITLRNGSPLSTIVSGTSLTYNSPNWSVTGYTLVAGTNSVPTGYSDSARGRFFRTISYAPISSAAGGNSRGLWKLRIGNQVGNFKFNKIGLYASRFLADGTEDTSVDPVLFAVVNLVDPIIKSSDTSNIAYFELDLELEISSNNTFGQYSFLSNNNWNYIAGEQALWFDGRVAVGTSGLPTSWFPRAKLQLVENNEAVPLQRWSRDNSTYTSDMFLEDAGDDEMFQMFRSHRPNYRVLFETSGADSGSSWSKIGLQVLHNSLNRSIDMYSTHPTSGGHRSGMEAVFEGYLEKLNLSVDGENFFTSRGLQSTYGTIVLGRSSDTLFEHPGKFLTVHGGTLLVGSSLVSGTLSGGDLVPNSVTTEGLIVSTTGLVAPSITTGLIIGSGSGGIIAGRNLLITTSANFAGPVTFSNGGTISGGNLAPNSIFTEGLIISTNAILGSSLATGLIIGTGSGGVIAGRNLSITTSAHFAGPITVSNTISAASSITTSSLVTDDLYVEGTANFQNVIFGTMTGNSLELSTNSIVGGNLNVSGLAALGANLYMDNGDVAIRKKGNGITANITTVAATGSSPMTATFSNGESFGIVTGWNTAAELVIQTTRVTTSSLILYSIRGTIASALDAGHFISSISAGTSFTLRVGTPTTNITVSWMIINPSP